jgi:hypothetical protein
MFELEEGKFSQWRKKVLTTQRGTQRKSYMFSSRDAAEIIAKLDKPVYPLVPNNAQLLKILRDMSEAETAKDIPPSVVDGVYEAYLANRTKAQTRGRVDLDVRGRAAPSITSGAQNTWADVEKRAKQSGSAAPIDIPGLIGELESLQRQYMVLTLLDTTGVEPDYDKSVMDKLFVWFAGLNLKAKYNYVGPGTGVYKNFENGELPTNILDAGAFKHDLQYLKISTMRDPKERARLQREALSQTSFCRSTERRQD